MSDANTDSDNDTDRRIAAISGTDNTTADVPVRGYLFALILFGPLGIFSGVEERDFGKFAWGVATTLLYLSVIGLLFTASAEDIFSHLGLESTLILMKAAWASFHSTAIDLISDPTTWAATFILAGCGIAYGSYRLVKSGSLEDDLK